MNRRDFGAMLLAAGAAGCDMFKDKKQPLPGERISVLGVGAGIAPDPNLASTPVALPAATVNPDWPQPGGNTSHSMGHPALPERLSRVWETRIGEGSSRYSRVLSQPVVGGGRIYAMDGSSQVTALDAATGGRIWQVDLKPEKERGSAFGGGPSLWRDRLYVGTGFAEVVALNLADGAVIWRQMPPGAAPRGSCRGRRPRSDRRGGRGRGHARRRAGRARR